VCALLALGGAVCELRQGARPDAAGYVTLAVTWWLGIQAMVPPSAVLSADGSEADRLDRCLLAARPDPSACVGPLQDWARVLAGEDDPPGRRILRQSQVPVLASLLSPGRWEARLLNPVPDP